MAHTLGASRLTRRSILRLSAGAFVLPLLAACQPAAQPTGSSQPAQTAPAAKSKVDTVNVGVVLPITGDLNRPGQTILNGMQLGVEDINAAGGVKGLGGAKLNLVTTDIRSDDKVTRTETERIITSNKLSAVMGAYASALSLVASEVTERSKIPFLTASIANALVDRSFKYIFQISPRASQFGEGQVKLAIEAASGQKKAAIIYENTAYGTSTSKGIQETADKSGLEIVLNEGYEKSFTDAGPLVNKIKASGAQVLFPVSYPNDTVLIVRTMKQQNVKTPMVAGGAGFVLPDFGQAFGDDANGVLSIEAWNHDISEDSLAVDKRYRAKHNEFLQEYAGESYALLHVLVDALERAGSVDPEAVREALTKTNLTKGFGAMMPGGHVEFDEKGWNKHAFPVGAQWQQGDFVTVYPKEVAKAQLIKSG
ncbi:MAG: ABC transporter substrate-binding protein [Chloroflexi bacterium]|nr:ABC transporter substrate-binding protein [Chloroflexota bacterium]